MTTLTITDAKKNLTKWLKLAANGGEVAIICGADIVALRKVSVQAADYAWTEYGLTQEDVAAYGRKVDVEHDLLKKTGKLTTIRNRKELEAIIEKGARRPA